MRRTPDALPPRLPDLHHPVCPRPSRRLAAALLCLGLLAALPSASRAQVDVWVPEIPLTRDSGTHARALGMGGAYLAVSDDIGALRYNPAGLARIQRPEFSGSFTDRTVDIDVEASGVLSQASLGRTRLSSLGFVYPFPTYRGSMVIALGYGAPWLLDREYLRRTYAGTSQPGAVDEQIFEDGQVGEWSFGYAVDASPTLSLGLRASLISGSRQQDWAYTDENFLIHDFLDVDLSGVTAALGAQSILGRGTRLGLTVDLPRWIWIEGAVTDIDLYDWTIDEKMTLPWSAGAGLAWTWEKLLLAGDVRFTDWTQIDYEGALRYFDESGRRQMAYRRTWDLHLGGEYLLDGFSSLGVRLRAGVAREPVPYGVMLEAIGVDDEGYALPVYREAEFSPDRLTWTAGIGLLLQQSLTIDVAYARGSYERTGLSLREKETEQRLLVSAAFRLE